MKTLKEQLDKRIDELRADTAHPKSEYTLTLYGFYGLHFLQYYETQEGSEDEDLKEVIAKHAAAFLQAKEAEGKSDATIRMYWSVFRQLSGKQIDYQLKAQKDMKRTRSRTMVRSDNIVFDTKRHALLHLLERATGCRRKEMERLKWSDFQEIDGRLFVSVGTEKKSRLVPVLPSLEEEVREVWQKDLTADIPIFRTVNCYLDCGKYRRKYAQNLYAEAVADDKLCDDLLAVYPPEYTRETERQRQPLVVEETEGHGNFIGSHKCAWLIACATGSPTSRYAAEYFLI